MRTVCIIICDCELPLLSHHTQPSYAMVDIVFHMLLMVLSLVGSIWGLSRDRSSNHRPWVGLHVAPASGRKPEGQATLPTWKYGRDPLAAIPVTL